MGIKDLIEKANSRSKRKKELLRSALEQDNIIETVQERKKSANEREVDRFTKEKREGQIKEKLDVMRRERRDEIAFDHNPLDVKNITAHTQWNVLKERNQFTNKGNMFENNENIHKSNKNLLKSGNMLNNQKNIMSSKNSMFSNKGGGLI